MHKANVNDRQTVETFYTLEAFAEDAARNARSVTEVVYGVRIQSAPDESGWFALARAQHHVGELSGFAETVFIVASEPHLMAALVGQEPGKDAAEGPVEAPRARAEEYGSFIDRVLEAARTAEFQDPIGRGEDRLRGFHGG